MTRNLVGFRIKSLLLRIEGRQCLKKIIEYFSLSKLKLKTGFSRCPEKLFFFSPVYLG